MISSLIKSSLFVLFLSSCASAKLEYKRRDFRRAKTIAVYSQMANEFVDDYLVLKENGFFEYYQKLWVIVNIRMGAYIGRYTQTGDTLTLDWLGVDPKSKRYYFSHKVLLDSSKAGIMFVDELAGKVNRRMSLTHSR